MYVFESDDFSEKAFLRFDTEERIKIKNFFICPTTGKFTVSTAGFFLIYSNPCRIVEIQPSRSRVFSNYLWVIVEWRR